MNNELARQPPSGDGFADYRDDVEGGGQSQASGPIRGALLKFSNEAAWVIHRTDEVIPPERNLAVAGLRRLVQKWTRDNQAETFYLGPHEKFPDVEQMNVDTPRTEWVKGFDGKPKGPWAVSTAVYLFDPHTMEFFTYMTGGTIGGRLAVADLVERTQMMRRVRGANVAPVVGLSSKHMSTATGGRMRPAFEIRDWMELGGDGKDLPEQLPALPAATATTIDALAIEKPTPTAAEARDRFKVVKPASLKEEVDDDIPF